MSKTRRAKYTTGKHKKAVLYKNLGKKEKQRERHVSDCDLTRFPDDSSLMCTCDYWIE